jgi:hypothetical protein
MGAKIKKIVLFRNALRACESDIESLFSKYKSLSKQLHGFSVVSGGGVQFINPLTQGFTHGLIFAFSDQAALDCYMSDMTAHDLNRQAAKLFRYPEDVLIMNLPEEPEFAALAWENLAAA